MVGLGFNRLALKSFNRSVKAELTNIAASYLIRMRDQLPRQHQNAPGPFALARTLGRMPE